jgi:hypothetical protein
LPVYNSITLLVVLYLIVPVMGVCGRSAVVPLGIVIAPVVFVSSIVPLFDTRFNMPVVSLAKVNLVVVVLPEVIVLINISQYFKITKPFVLLLPALPVLSVSLEFAAVVPEPAVVEPVTPLRT